MLRILEFLVHNNICYDIICLEYEKTFEFVGENVNE